MKISFILFIFYLTFFNTNGVEVPEHIKSLLKHISIFSKYHLVNEVCEQNAFVNTSSLTYKGCKNSVPNESVGGPKQNVPIYSFKGIPFAEPPVGELRYRKPVPKRWSTKALIDATKFGKPCMQPPVWLASDPNEAIDHSEDCLTLNVWTPDLNQTANLCVMVWIHGGGFLWGGSSFFDASQLALHNCVVVSMNYRLGSFGFLVGDGDDAPGNQALWDQALALNWTKQNIHTFGGNSNNITLFGESAGSMAASNQVVSKVSNGFFNRAILQSGASTTTLFSRPKHHMKHVSQEFARNKLCADQHNYVQCLRKIPAERIVTESLIEMGTKLLRDALLTPIDNPWFSDVLLTFVPIFGDEFMPKNLNQSIISGSVPQDMDVMIGHTETEGVLFCQLFDLTRLRGMRYQPHLPLHAEGFINKHSAKSDIIDIFINNKTFDNIVAEEYTKGFSSLPILSLHESNRLRSTACQSFGDYALTCPMVLMGEMIAKNRKPNAGRVFQYKLAYTNKQSPDFGSDWALSTHFDDVPLVFGFPFLDKSLYTDKDREFSSKLMKVWTNFAKTGSAQMNGFSWPAYNAIDGKTNLSYVELHPNSDRFGKIYTKAYEGNDGFDPKVMNNCKNFWDFYLWKMF